MRNRRETVTGLLFAVVLAALVLTGCRAFQPEAVVVNKPPETFIIGAPPYDGGGYYHFHVFWYGSDADGTVEKFVWALTDTTIQDEDTTDDEEDQRFNPALDASTLEIGRYTTRTDSVFDFKIDQGIAPSYDMTLHMVAIDDFGDFDRTPARLHFFSNTLGNPSLTFFRIEGTDTIPIPQGVPDTVGFGFPYTVYWAGQSPNIRGFSEEQLAAADTVLPYWDGLLGFKYLLSGDLGGNCVPSLEDCWNPRRFNEATGDSFSVFSDSVRTLAFRNDNSSDDPFGKLLPSGAVNLQVNSIDIAGVEVANFMRPFSFLVNFDPQTLILDGETDWAHPEDTESYPYYILLNDPSQTHYPFESGDRIPDRTYVVVKALARDDPRDGKLNDNFKIGISGFLQGTRRNFFGGNFSFQSESSVLNTNPPWDANVDGWYADTLGFLTGPNSEFTINMQSVDEHGRRDGSPASLSFDVGYPPCIQCVELLPKRSSTSAFDRNVECVDSVVNSVNHPCFQDTTTLYVSTAGAGPDDLQFIQPIWMLVDKSTGFVRFTDDPAGQAELNYTIQANLYEMQILLHGQDDPRESYSQAVRRILGWNYQVDFDCDPFNQIRDGGGNDDLQEPTWGPSSAPGLEIDQVTGLWKLSVQIVIPTGLLSFGPDSYKVVLPFPPSNVPPEDIDMVFAATTMQTGTGTVRAVALDQTQCSTTPPARPGKYNFFRKVRPQVAELGPGQDWRDCNLEQQLSEVQLGLDLGQGAMSSLDGEAVTKHFRIIVTTSAGEYQCPGMDGN